MMFRIKSKGWKEFLSCSFKGLIFFPNKDSRKKNTFAGTLKFM